MQFSSLWSREIVAIVAIDTKRHTPFSRFPTPHFWSLNFDPYVNYGHCNLGLMQSSLRDENGVRSTHASVFVSKRSWAISREAVMPMAGSRLHCPPVARDHVVDT